MTGEMILLGLAGVIEAGAPIVVAAIGETITERAGVINLSLNGLIILSAMMGFWVSLETESLLLGFLTGALVGAIVSSIIAFSSITLKQSQVAVGFILAITCEDLAYFLGNPIMGAQAPIMYATPIPFLSDIPILGPLFFAHSIMTYLSLILIFVAWFWISKTRPGLMLRGLSIHHSRWDVGGTGRAIVYIECESWVERDHHWPEWDRMDCVSHHNIWRMETHSFFCSGWDWFCNQL